MSEARLETQAGSQAAKSGTRPLYWSVRREIWENRSIYVVPLVAAALMMLAFLIPMFHMAASIQGTKHDEANHRMMLGMPYGHASMGVMLAAFLAGVFYCLDALHGERRDRSVLFWKSLPVSDLTAVISKAAIPMVVLPGIVLVVLFATHLAMLVISNAVALLGRLETARMWARVPFIQLEVVLAYAIVITALWYAPIYGWLLLVSGWARRAALVWAVLPPLGACAFERVAFNTTHLWNLLIFVFVGGFVRGFSPRNGIPIEPHLILMDNLDPGKFLSTPELWVGLAVMAVFLVAAARLRRSHGPI